MNLSFPRIVGRLFSGPRADESAPSGAEQDAALVDGSESLSAAGASQALSDEIALHERTAADLLDQYGVREGTLHSQTIHDKLLSIQRVLFDAFGSVANLQDKVIVDIGCGARRLEAADDGKYVRAFEPWACRVAHALGARVVGFDIRSQLGEPFKWAQLDLAERGALLMSARNLGLFGTVDAFIMDGIHDATFHQQMQQHGIAKEEILSEIDLVCHRMLKPDGCRIGTIYRPDGSLIGGLADEVAGGRSAYRHAV